MPKHLLNLLRALQKIVGGAERVGWAKHVVEVTDPDKRVEREKVAVSMAVELRVKL